MSRDFSLAFLSVPSCRCPGSFLEENRPTKSTHSKRGQKWLEAALENHKTATFPHQAGLSFQKLFETRQFSDVVLRFEGDNTRTLKAHKLVLQMQSPVFEAMFAVDMKEKLSGEIVIKEVSFEVMKIILRFLYTGLLEMTELEENAIELYKAADLYELKYLKTLCQEALFLEALYTNTELKQAKKILDLADLYSMPELRDRMMDSIRTRASDDLFFLTDDAQLNVAELIQSKLAQETSSQVIP